MNDCKYRRLDSIKLNNKTVFIDEDIKCIPQKEVYKVIFDLEDKKQYILKAIYGEDIEAKNTIEFYMNDTHSYFMEVVDFYKDSNKIFLLLKYYQDGTLYTLDNPTPQERDRLIANILEIGCYLHKNGYIHGDIKPDNFFIDGDKVRVGDLESIIKLDNIHTQTIETLSGTGGFKYSHNHTYTLQDEIFAYIATIYYIEMGELLITKEDFADLTQEENPFKEINNFAIEQIEYIDREPIKNFLLDILDQLKDNQKIDCCSMQEHFNLARSVDFSPRNKEDNEITGTKVPAPKWKKLLPILLGGFIIISSSIFFLTQPNTPTCHKAFFATDNIIRVEHKNGNIDFYDYSDNKFVYIRGERSLNFVDRERLFRNSKGVGIECEDGRVRVF